MAGERSVAQAAGASQGTRASGPVTLPPLSPTRPSEATEERSGERRRPISEISQVVDEDGDGKISLHECLRSFHRLRRHFKFDIMRRLGGLRFLDHFARWLVPLVFVPYLLFKLSVVEFGGPHQDRLRAGGCPKYNG